MSGISNDDMVEKVWQAMYRERDRCAELVEDAWDDCSDWVTNRDCPQQDIPDLYAFCQKLATRIRSGE